MMTKYRRLAVIFTLCAYSALTPLSVGAQPSVATHTAILREGAFAWLLRVGGAGIDRQDGSNKPRPVIDFRDQSGAAFRWSIAPTAFARWNREWLIANGSHSLYKFSSAGVFVDRIPIAIAATDIIAADRKIWIYSAGPDSSLLVADEELAFHQVPGQNTRAGLSAVQKAVDAILVLAAGRHGNLLYTHLIGPPVLFQVTTSKRTQIPLAYCRTQRRASLTAASPDVDQLAYSSPARDIVALSLHEIVVLRNLEDISTRENGRTEPFVGRRADIYQMPEGTHTGTATFAEPTRWLLRVSDKTILAIARSGRIVQAPIGKPIPSSIVR